MKLKITAFMALLSALALAGCSSDEKQRTEPGPQEQGQSVFLKINGLRTAQARSNEPSATGSTAELYSALIYFLDDATNPQIHSILTVGENGQDITLADLEDGYRVENISSTVTQVYVVGNYNAVDINGDGADFPMEIGETLADIEDVILNIEQVSHGALLDGTTITDLITVMQGREDLVLFSDAPGGWTGDGTPATTDYYAEVTISPLVARIEIEQITYTGDYRNLTLSGIFINNYYQELPVTLSRAGYNPTNNGSDVTRYTVGNANFAYTDYMTMYDAMSITATPTGTATFTPSNGTWAYHVFGNSNPVPHIILKFTGVTSSTGVDLRERYVTVSGLIGPGGTPLTVLDRNTIYKLEDLEFTNGDTAPVPEPEDINVWINVTVQPWTTVLVTPQL